MIHPHKVARRSLLAGLAAAALLPGCATTNPYLDLTEAVRRLLLLSTDRAVARLLDPDQVLDSDLARLDLPPQLDRDRGSAALRLLLSTRLVQDRLRRELAYAAADAVQEVEPFIESSVRSLTIADAAEVLRGGPDAGTVLLRGAIYGGVVDRLSPAFSDALRDGDASLVAEALRLATGVDVTGVTRDLGRRIGDALFSAIAREEAAIRRDPRSVRDPFLERALLGEV
jgi:hypothetical protein